MLEGFGVLVVNLFFFFLGVTTSEGDRTDRSDMLALAGEPNIPEESKSRNSGASQLPSLSNTEACGMDSISTTKIWGE